MNAEPAFMELVQLHERMWGMEPYPGRPSLSDLLQHPIVVMWTNDDKRTTEKLSAGTPRRFVFTVYDKVEELNDVLLAMILASRVTATSNRKISRIFVKQKPANVTGIRLMVSTEETN
jgi:hypothetical protein